MQSIRDGCSSQGAGMVGLKGKEVALAGVAQGTECRPANQRVTGSIPIHSTCLGCGPGPQLGACTRQLTNIPLTY